MNLIRKLAVPIIAIACLPGIGSANPIFVEPGVVYGQTDFSLWSPNFFPPYESLTSGYIYGGSSELSYDADSNILQSVFSGSFDYHPDYYDLGIGGETLAIDGVIAFAGQVDVFGNVTDPGSLLVLGDVGAGLEVLLSGSMLGHIGLQSVFTPIPTAAMGTETSNYWLWQGMEIIFEIDFAHESLAGLFPYVYFAFPVESSESTPSPFGESFALGGSDFWSDPGFIGLKRSPFDVPEPGTLALLGIGLLGMGLVRRKKQLA